MGVTCTDVPGRAGAARARRGWRCPGAAASRLAAGLRRALGLLVLVLLLPGLAGVAPAAAQPRGPEPPASQEQSAPPVRSLYQTQEQAPPRAQQEQEQAPRRQPGMTAQELLQLPRRFEQFGQPAPQQPMPQDDRRSAFPMPPTPPPRWDQPLPGPWPRPLPGWPGASSQDDARPAARMPDLSGESCETARRIVQQRLQRPLRSCGPGKAIGRVPPGAVNAQQPPADAPVSRNTVLRAWIEPEPPSARLQVPNVTGRPEAEAPATPGRIQLQVPDVTGQRLPEAQSRITEIGLEAGADSAQQSGARRVERQSPAGGTWVAAGSRVDLVTYLEVSVPDVVQHRLPQAISVLSQQGLRARTDVADVSPQWRVQSQAPAAGTLVRERSEVTLAAVRMAQVPVLTDMSCDRAHAAASAARLGAVRCGVDSLLPVVLGTPVVVSQSVTAGNEVEESTVLTLQARAPAWSAPATIAMVLFAAGAALRKLARPNPRSPHGRGPAPAPVPVSVPVPPAVPAGSGPSLHWRVQADTAPRTCLRWQGQRPTPQLQPQELRVQWHCVLRPGVTCLRGRGLDFAVGDGHDQR